LQGTLLSFGSCCCSTFRKRKISWISSFTVSRRIWRRKSYNKDTIQIVPGFACVVQAHCMHRSNSDTSTRRKYMFLTTSCEVKMLHHGLPTHLIEYQQKIVQVSMQISYRKQKHDFLFFFFLIVSQGGKKWNYKTGIS